MRKIVMIILLALILALSTSTVSYAVNPPIPVGGCPVPFELMEAGMHDMMEHTHAGLHVDLNKDGRICMYEATNTIHVHMDNVVVTP